MKLHITKPFLVLSIVFLAVFVVMALKIAIIFFGSQLLANLEQSEDGVYIENVVDDDINANIDHTVDGSQYGNRFIILFISLPVIYGFVPFAVFHTIYIVKSKQNKKIKAANEPAF